MKRLLVLALAALAAAVAPSFARAGYPVQPSPGTVVQGQPTFLVYVDDGETLAEVDVASDPGMSNFQGMCDPTTPFGEPHKYTCTLSYTRLQPGTYYWTFSYWKNDDCQTFFGSTFCYPKEHLSPPMQFTVAAPTAPVQAGLVSPSDGATVGMTPTLTVSAPAGSTLHTYIASTTDRFTDGSPMEPVDSCDGSVASDGNYTCTVTAYLLDPGSTYYWWAIISVNGASWIYGPRSLTVREPTTSSDSSTGGTSSSTGAGSLTESDAPALHRSAHFSGQSVLQSRLSDAAYGISKYIGAPKMIDIACWSGSDWTSVSGDNGDGYYTTLGFYDPMMPHWIHLSPTVCRAMETLLYHRPRYPNRFTSNAVETVTHEEIHALGITKARYGNNAEPLAECYAMQLSILMAIRLGVPYPYANQLAKINLINYANRPPNYRNYSNCRENGAWDLFKNHPSPPWHTFK